MTPLNVAHVTASYTQPTGVIFEWFSHCQWTHLLHTTAFLHTNCILTACAHTSEIPSVFWGFENWHVYSHVYRYSYWTSWPQMQLTTCSSDPDWDREVYRITHIWEQSCEKLSRAWKSTAWGASVKLERVDSPETNICCGLEALQLQVLLSSPWCWLILWFNTGVIADNYTGNIMI